MAAQALLRRGKRHVARYFKEECSRPSGHPQLDELLDYLLDPNKKVDDFEIIDWCKNIIAAGMTFEEFRREGTCI